MIKVAYYSKEQQFLRFKNLNDHVCIHVTKRLLTTSSPTMTSKRCCLYFPWIKFRSLLILLTLFCFGMLLSFLMEKAETIATKDFGSSKLWLLSSESNFKNTKDHNKLKATGKMKQNEESNRKSENKKSRDNAKESSFEKTALHNRSISTTSQPSENDKQLISSSFATSQFSLPANFETMTDKKIIFPVCGGKNQLYPWFYSKKVKFDMIVLVKTAPQNIKLRNVLRRSWGSVQSIRRTKFATIFLLGQASSNKKNDLLKKENNLFGDMLQCQFTDKYEYLPVKVSHY